MTGGETGARTEVIGAGLDAADVLGRLHDATRDRGLPPPAALVGDWLGHDAVVAPSVDVRAGHTPDHAGVGWWFGALAYPDRAGESALPAVLGGHTDSVLWLRDGRWRHVSVSGAGCPEWVRDCVTGDPVETAPWEAAWRPPSRATHERAVRDCLDAIAAGEIYQACICTRFTGSLRGRAVDLFRTGVHAMTPRKSAFFAGAWGAVASFSPETYLRRTGDRVSSSPIKGTLPADADPAMLARSAKDIAENVMIVDLIRNDLGRVAVPGTVVVPELLAVHPAPGVWHLVSTVSATVPTTVGTAELLEATFPPGSVTGTPKIRARQLLAGWETDARGVYCGAIGVIAPDGDLDLNVAIRTVEVDADGAVALGVGGGITADSDPDSEWQECLDKAASILATGQQSPGRA